MRLELSLWRFHETVLDASISEPTLRCLVAGDRVGASEAFRDQHVWIAVGFDERVANRLCSLLRYRKIYGLVARVVRVPRDLRTVPGATCFANSFR